MYQLVLALHLLGAAVWTGGHLILSLAVLPAALRRRELAPLQAFEARFERVGLPALAVQVLTGLWLAHRLAPTPNAWFSIEGQLERHIGAKLVLLGLTVALAAHARLRLIPRLTPERLPLLAAHIVAVTATAVLFVLVGLDVRFGAWL
ncbi:MAG: copper resistance protein CopD [Planctomycetota bacterium]|nr:MAG: copper resistance protein CopD [Planctomycetota bacterium]